MTNYYTCADCGARIPAGEACGCWSGRKPWLGYVLIASAVVSVALIWWGMS